MDLAYKIRTKRLQLKMTQEQMAGRLGVTAPAVHKWESGISFPSLMAVVAICNRFNLSVDELVLGINTH